MKVHCSRPRALFEASCIVRIAVAPVEIELAWPLPAAPSSTTLLRALLRRSQRLDAGETAIELLQSPQLPGYDPRPSSQSTVHPRTRRLEDAKRLGFSACALPRLGRPWHPSLVRVIPALAVRKSLAVPHLGHRLLVQAKSAKLVHAIVPRRGGDSCSSRIHRLFRRYAIESVVT